MQGGTGGVQTTNWRVRWRRRMHRHPAVTLLWRATILLVGGVVSIAGLIMLVTPGPGWLSLIAGLLILSLEFEWAERWLVSTRRAARRAQARALDPAARWRNLLAAAVLLVVAAAAAWWWVDSFGVPPPAASVYDAVVGRF